MSANQWSWPIISSSVRVSGFGGIRVPERDDRLLDADVLELSHAVGTEGVAAHRLILEGHALATVLAAVAVDLVDHELELLR